MQQEDGRADDVYENSGVIYGRSGKEITTCNITRIQSSKHTESDGVKIRSSSVERCVSLLLCVFLLTAVVALCVFFTQERQQLVSRNENLTRERDRLKQEKNDLQSSLGKVDGWICHQSSLYFFSSERKNWTESRRSCRERGADLIIINNREEEDFVTQVSVFNSVWIGLTDTDEEGRWKWVDGSTMTSGFWMSGEPNSFMGLEEDCVLASYGWNDSPCNVAYGWICEKTIF
ncbi:CD209 antigen-like protein C [Carassius auratus]|uniref:CD209 antigen-like protein C n=1 Tax=Carassius auratus TaxID=7957 RepID=A0A6P6MF65_CARAU|nr:CD209 antigen-like protein C [Carassius auratus]